MSATYCDVFSFLWRSILAMGRCFDCFRVRNDRHHHRHCLIPKSPPSSATENVDETIRFSSLFATEEEEECVVNEREQLVCSVSRLEIDVGLLEEEDVDETISFSSLFATEEEEEEEEECVSKEREKLVQRVSMPEIDVGLLEEVKLLKACGTLPETPAEIRKAVKFSDQVDISDIRNPLGALQSSPDTPPSIRAEEFLTECSLSENSGRHHSPVEFSPETPEVAQKSKFMSGTLEKSNVPGPRSMLKASPYPTPRRLTDDMQTPGTVYATNMKSLTVGNGRIRSQYVYTVLNPINSLHQLDDFSEEHSETHLASYHEKENLLRPHDATPLPAKGSVGKSVNEDTLGDASLSSWLKPPLASGGNDRHNEEVTSMRKPNVRDTPGDRPSIDLVAAHWNEQLKTPHIPPKWWGDNGIPNSTTKYKEDQKVRWHATPFEERLEKVLSEETCVPQRKPVTGAPILFEEMEGQDTAISQLQITPKSVGIVLM